MAVYVTASELARAARAAGFSGADLTTAVAVALAEASAPPHPETGEARARLDARCHDCLGVREDSNGPWQVNVDAHPHFDAGRLRTSLAYSAGAAFRVYRDVGGKFTPWSVYKNGSYKTHMAAAAKATGVPAGTDDGDDRSTVVKVVDAVLPGDPAATTAGALGAVQQLANPKVWLQVLLVVAFTAAGLWLIVTGLRMFVTDTDQEA